VILLILAAVGVSVGILLSKKTSSSRTSSTGAGSPSGGGGGGGGGNSTDPRLKKVFYAMAYTPDFALPDYNCRATQSKCHVFSGKFLT